ncbi:AMIN domain-containing protein [Azospirillum sp.]|uniref:AMIN domain-containing protein n=1 Tax=Azospirillum sp. TaxID=34012 RepID=UPI002D54B8EB|nr:AMIN domain-containing protein [Azospirillum sp.]HYD63851.1 AMIN domain-containing protein [Azospirillum sp.]
MTRSVVILALVALLPWWASTVAHWMGVRADFAERIFGKPTAEDIWDDLKPMPGWREDAYLAAYPDVADAVRKGHFATGYEHFRLNGRNEGRTAGLPQGPGPAMAVAIDPPSAEPPSPPSPAPSPTPSPPPAAARPPVPPPAPTVAAAPPAPPVAAPLPGRRPAPPPEPPEPAPAPAPGGASPAPLPPALPSVLAAQRQEAPKAPPTADRYVIRNGGTMAKVAEVTGIPLADIQKANPGVPNTWLGPGTVLALPAAPAPAPAVAAAPPEPRVTLAALPPAPPSPAAASDEKPAGSVTGIRFGMHPDSTRVVLDVSTVTPFRSMVQTDPRTIIVELPGARWETTPEGSVVRTAPPIAFHADPMPGGTRLTLTGRDDIRIKQAAAFPPEGARGHRIVIDVARAAP